MSDDGQYQTAVEYNGNIWKSTDFGANWTEVDLPDVHEWVKVAMSDNGQFQTAVAYSGNIWTSNDRGGNWTEVTSVSSPQLTFVAMSGNGMIQTAGLSQTGLSTFVSTDWGANWSTVVLGARTYNVEHGDMSNDGSIQVLVDPSTYESFVSNTSGSSWPTSSGESGYFHHPNEALWGLSISDSGKDITGVGNSGRIRVSNDFGTSWSVKNISSSDLFSVAVSSNGQIQTAVGNDAILSSSDYGDTWNETSVSGGDFYGIAMSANGTKQTAVKLNGKIWTCNAESSTPDEPSTPDAPVTPTAEPPAPPVTPTAEPPASPPSDSETLGAGAIAGIAVGSVAVVGIGVYVGFS